MAYLSAKGPLAIASIVLAIRFFGIATCLAMYTWAPSASAHVNPTSTVAATVRMTNLLQFDPATITVQAGASVEWRNASNFVHTVTDNPSKGATGQHMTLPVGAKRFNSGRISPGHAYTHKFAVPGIYHYVCSYHEAEGMIGTVIVAARH